MRLAATLLFLLAMPAMAAPAFESFELSADGTGLAYSDSVGATWQAPKRDGQVGYAQPRISPDGQFIGWLALHPNCCTSYPVPLVLVVMDADRNRYEFRGPQATFGWCFQPDSDEVAYRRAVLHGPTPEFFELRRIRDGALLETFEMPAWEPDEVRQAFELPSWARCATD